MGATWVPRCSQEHHKQAMHFRIVLCFVFLTVSAMGVPGRNI